MQANHICRCTRNVCAYVWNTHKFLLLMLTYSNTPCHHVARHLHQTLHNKQLTRKQSPTSARLQLTTKQSPRAAHSLGCNDKAANVSVKPTASAAAPQTHSTSSVPARPPQGVNQSRRRVTCRVHFLYPLHSPLSSHTSCSSTLSCSSRCSWGILQLQLQLQL